MLSFDRTFQPDAYAIREGIADPARRSVHYFPDASVETAAATVSVVVNLAAGPAWTGCFGAAETHARGGITGVIALPDAESFGVLNQGALYVACAGDPDRASVVRAGGVHQAVALRGERLVLCADAGSIIAFGEEGLRWETDLPRRLDPGSSLRITGVGQTVAAEWSRDDSPLTEPVAFDLRTGALLAPSLVA